MSMFIRLGITLFFGSAVICSPLYVYALDTRDTTRIIDSVSTPEEALDASLHYTGFPNGGKSRQSAALDSEIENVLMTDSTTAFVSRDIDGRSAWHIRYHRFTLHLDTAYDYFAVTRPKKADVFLDNPSGKFLSAVISDDLSDLQLDRRPTTSEAEHLLSTIGEKYLGLPEDSPSIDILTALKQCKGYPLAAKEILVSYVVYSFKDQESFPAWVIYMRGLPPWTASGSVPDHVRTNMKCVVNATTGELYLTNNVPYPQLVEDSAASGE